MRGREGRARVGGVCDQEGGMAWEREEICSIGELTTAVQISSKLSTISNLALTTYLYSFINR